MLIGLVSDFAEDALFGELVDEVGDFLLRAVEELDGGGYRGFTALVGGFVAVEEYVLWGVGDLG